MPWRTPAIMRRNIMKKGKKCKNIQDIMKDCMQWALYDVAWGCRAIGVCAHVLWRKSLYNYCIPVEDS